MDERGPAAARTARWTGVLAWLPLPLLLAAIVAARIAGLRETFQSPTLLLLLSFAFYTAVSLGTLLLIARSFLATGMPGLLLLECGVVLWSLAGTVGDAVWGGDANINVTIFNCGILLAGMCHLAGAALALGHRQIVRARALWLAAGFALALAALGLITGATLAGWMPVFFVTQHGGTPVRYMVLLSAITLFVLSASLLLARRGLQRTPFATWYARALLLLAVGLFGVMIQRSMGSAVNWLGRTAQWTGGLYLLVAAIAAVRGSHLPLLPEVESSRPAYHRDAMAVVVVLAAAALRLAFLSALGDHAPYVVFYPAVMLAALYGGLRAGLLATVTTILLVAVFWFLQGGALEPPQWLSMVIFLLSAGMLSGITGALFKARARAAAAETQALIAAEREAAADAMREAEARYRNLFENMTEEVHFWQLLRDGHGRIRTWRLVDANPPALRTWGRTLDAVRGRTTDEIFGPGATEHFLPVVKKIMAEGVPHSYEDYFPNLDKYFRFTSVPLGDFFITTGADITGVRKAHEQLRDAQRVAHLGNWHWDAATDVTTGSDELLRIFGLDPAKESMPDFRDQKGRCYPVEDWERLDAAVQEAVRTGVGYELDLRAFRDGAPIWVTTRSEVIRDPAGRTVGLRGTIQDVTARREAQEALRQLNESLEQRVAERTGEIEQQAARLRELASEVTMAEHRERQRLARVLHDQVQQLLVAARLHAGLLKRRSREPDVVESAQQLDDLLSQTLDASRSLTTELSPPILHDGGLGPALDWLARRMGKSHNLAVDVAFDPVAEPSNPDARIFLFEAVRELLLNAVKHAGVDRARVEVDRDPEGRIRVAVSDDGVGFDPGRPRPEGAVGGFGLFSIQQRLGFMGGSTDVASSPGRGTRITLVGPLPKADVGGGRRPAADVSGGSADARDPGTRGTPGRIRVVLADDHMILRQGLTALLGAEGDIDIVGEATDGAEAVALARSLRPDVIVMDVSMPNVNGVEATRRIVAELPGVRVIGLSLHESSDMADAMREAGAVAYATKGGPSDVLIAAIRKAAGRPGTGRGRPVAT